MTDCCKQAVPPEVIRVDQAQVPNLRDETLLSLPPLPAVSSDLKGVLVQLRNEFAATATRQERFLTQLLNKQAELHEEMAAMRSTAKIQVVRCIVPGTLI